MVPINRRGEGPADELKRFLASYPGRVLIAVDSAGRREALIEQLAQAGLHPKVVASWQEFVFTSPLVGEVDAHSASGEGMAPKAPAAQTQPLSPTPLPQGERGLMLCITVAALDDGFALSGPPLTVLTDRQLFGERAQQTRRRKTATRDPETILRDLSELNLGSPIVHTDNGVGRYQGLVKLDVGGGGEFLAIDYAKGDKLYVPVAQLHLVSRYPGTAPELAPLLRSAAKRERAKRRAAQKARDAAAELTCAVRATRGAAGHAFV